MRTQIIEKKKYRGKVEKIKTIGSTYMAATGLGENQVRSEHTYIHTYINIHLSRLPPATDGGGEGENAPPERGANGPLCLRTHPNSQQNQQRDLQ